MRANQLRLGFSSVGTVLVTELRRRALHGTELGRAQVGTVRSRLIKLWAAARVSLRPGYLSLSSAFPMQEGFHLVLP